MMRCVHLAIIALLCATNCFASEIAFYALRYKTADRMALPEHTMASLKKNYQKIDIFIPQAYSVNAAGAVNKNIEPELLAFAQKHKMKIMPLVTNENFSKDVAHAVLVNEAT